MGIGPQQVVHVRLLCFAQLLLLALGLLLLNVSVGAFSTILVAKEPLQLSSMPFRSIDDTYCKGDLLRGEYWLSQLNFSLTCFSILCFDQGELALKKSGGIDMML